jgi:hypothetical protein
MLDSRESLIARDVNDLARRAQAERAGAGGSNEIGAGQLGIDKAQSPTYDLFSGFMNFITQGAWDTAGVWDRARDPRGIADLESALNRNATITSRTIRPATGAQGENAR